jgi:hypothetical protein
MIPGPLRVDRPHGLGVCLRGCLSLGNACVAVSDASPHQDRSGLGRQADRSGVRSRRPRAGGGVCVGVNEKTKGERECRARRAATKANSETQTTPRRHPVHLCRAQPHRFIRVSSRHARKQSRTRERAKQLFVHRCSPSMSIRRYAPSQGSHCWHSHWNPHFVTSLGIRIKITLCLNTSSCAQANPPYLDRPPSGPAPARRDYASGAPSTP